MTDDRWDAMADIGRLGLETAATVVERILDLSRQATNLTVPLLTPTGDGDAARRLRSDAERLIDMYAEWTRTLVDRAIEVAGSRDILILGPVAAGESAEGPAWLHGPADGASSTTAPVFRMTALTGNDGTVLDADVAFEGSEPVRVRVHIPPDTAPGRYHGHLLVAGLDDVALAVRVVVT